MPDEYRRFWISSSAALDRELLLAEAFEAGAEGAEESEDSEKGEPTAFRACVYAPVARIEAVRDCVQTAAPEGTDVGAIEAMPAVDWSEAWKEGLEALSVSDRLVVRPPFIDFPLAPGQQEVVIDPGQAFGTGNHASTKLCLAWIDAIYDPAAAESAKGFARPSRVLDVGTGSGVLAFACVKLGATRAIGFDLDPVAIEAAVVSAEQNGLADCVELFTGPIEALGTDRAGFPLIVANLLKREILPVANAVAERLAPKGRLVLSGLLEEDEPEVLARFAEVGLVPAAPRREFVDEIGLWVSPLLTQS